MTYFCASGSFSDPVETIRALETQYDQAKEEVFQKTFKEMPESAKKLLQEKYSDEVALAFCKEVVSFVDALPLPQERTLFHEYVAEALHVSRWPKEEIDEWCKSSSLTPFLFDFYQKLGKKHFFLPFTDLATKKCVMAVSECAYNFGTTPDHIRKVLNLSPTDETFDPNLICIYSPEGLLLRKGLWPDVFRYHEEMAAENTSVWLDPEIGEEYNPLVGKTWVRADLLAEFILTSIGRKLPVLHTSIQNTPPTATVC